MTAASFTYQQIDPLRDRSWVLGDMQPDLSAEEYDNLVIRTAGIGDESTFIAALDGSVIAGLVCFITHGFASDSQHIPAYQAAGVFTSIKFRGRGVFPGIVRSFEQSMADSTGMIFGFPNANAFPIWTEKLGYDAIPCRKWTVPIGWLFNRGLVRSGIVSDPKTIYQDDPVLMARKARLHGDTFQKHSVQDDYIWGRERVRTIKGIKLKVFDLGGLRFSNSENLVALLDRVAGSAEPPRLLTATGLAASPLTHALRLGRASPFAYEVMIFKTFGQVRLGAQPLAIYTGVTDWF